MARTKKKGKTPSREKYDKTHPVVSVRVSPEVNDALEAAKRAGQSTLDVIKIGLGLLKVKIKNEEKVRMEGYDAGFEEGCVLTQKNFLVTYKCSVCGELIDVSTDAEKRAIRQYIQNARWAHAGCVKRQ